ncbi:MAG: hypothetical protein FD146_830 [Anaerolineaceae bacterium]|nr:MAG: hypothetical protein FD146_830 [Anaerolineaceae bacterium]
MLLKRPKAFLDTSVIIAALMSPSGGARLLFHLSHAGAIQIVVGKGGLQETEEVLRRKASGLMGLLAQLLDEANVEIGAAPTSGQQAEAQSLLDYPPDASILAQAIASRCEWFVTHDKEHFLSNPALDELSFQIGAPGDIIAWLRQKTE